MDGIWVCKPDGTIQCQNEPEITLAEARNRLALLVGEQNILEEKKHYIIVIRMCGVPTGGMNAFKLTPEGFKILMEGFAGPMGFRECLDSERLEASEPGTEEDGSSEDTGDVTLPALLASGRVSSVANNPVLVRELIGRPFRPYLTGAALTEDFVAERVNIEFSSHGRIVDIWFG